MPIYLDWLVAWEGAALYLLIIICIIGAIGLRKSRSRKKLE